MMIVFVELTFLPHYSPQLLKAHPAPASPELKLMRSLHKLSPLAVQRVLPSSHRDLNQEPELLPAVNTHWLTSDPRGNQRVFFFHQKLKREDVE